MVLGITQIQKNKWKLRHRDTRQNAQVMEQHQVGSTCLSTRIADFLLKLGQQYGGVTVNSIAGADHSRGSSHYRGTTIDVGALKGRRLDDAEMAQLVVNTCVLDMGGRAISNPGGRKIQNTVNYGGHRTWVHCSLRL